MTSLLTLNRLEIGYPGLLLSSPLTAEIPENVRIGVVGANGSGKSTLIKTLVGLKKPRGGSYSWKAGTTFGYVPQENRLDPLFPLNVEDLLKMGAADLPLLGMPEMVAAEISEVLEEMEMTALRGTLVRDLSGGMRQRALIARALMGRPAVLVLDEAYNFLDHAFRPKLRAIFERRRETSGFSLLIVEHDLNLLFRQLDERTDWAILLGREKTLIGRLPEIVTEKSLSAVYGTEVHLHKENGETQAHIL